MAIFKTRREENLKFDLEQLAYGIAQAKGEADAVAERLALFDDYEAVKKQLSDKQIELDRVHEDHARSDREIEHKLGLHKIQVEQERTAAVTEAKLAVREEALKAQEDRFGQEMAFMRERMENEIESQRVLMRQILDRLPHFTHSRVEHVGADPNPAQRLEITEG